MVALLSACEIEQFQSAVSVMLGINLYSLESLDW